MVPEVCCPRCGSTVRPPGTGGGALLCPRCGQSFEQPALAGGPSRPEETWTYDPGKEPAPSPPAKAPEKASGEPDTLTVDPVDQKTLLYLGPPEAAPTVPMAAPAGPTAGARLRSGGVPGALKSSFRVPAGRRADVLLARLLLERGAIDLDRANECLRGAREAGRPIADELAARGLASPELLSQVNAEASVIDREKPRSGVSETFGPYTFVRDGEDIVIQDIRSIRRFGKYEILGEIARGGMGVVYRARQEGIDRILALKILLSGAQASEEQIARFQREARMAANLSHPAIVPVYDVGDVSGEPYFTMEYVPGKSLTGLLKESAPSPKRAMEILLPLAGAVHYAHENGVIHRDLKPSNVLFDREGRPKITDFGLAKRIDSETVLTRSGQLLGTPAYMSPEQALGEHELVGPCSDIYSLGAILYEMLSGRRPHDAPTVAQVLYEIIHKDPPPLRRLNAEVHPDLEKICFKAMAKEPTRRYRTAGDLAADLANFMEGRAIVARAPGLGYRMRRFAAKHRLAVLALAVGLVAVAAVSGVLGRKLLAEKAERERIEAEQREQQRLQAEAYAQRLAAKPDFDWGKFYEESQPELSATHYQRALERDPTFDEAWLRLGRVYKALGRHEEALDACERAIEIAPQNFNAYNDRVVLLREQGRLEEALADCDRILEKSPKNAAALFNRGAIRLARGDYEGARGDFDGAILANPDFAKAHFYRAHLARRDGDLAAARKGYERALALDAGFVEARYRLARLLVQAGRPGDATGELDRALRDAGQPGRTIEIKSFERKILQARGLAHTLAAENDAALRDFARALELDPTFGVEEDRVLDSPEDRALPIEALVSWARTLQAAGKAMEAVESLSLLPESERARPEILALAVEARVRTGDLETARTLAEPLAAIPAEELPADALAALAELALSTGDLDGALSRAEALRAASREDRRAILDMALALASLSRQNEAKEALTWIGEADREWALARIGDWVERLHAKGEDGQALWWVERSIDWSPRDPELLAARLDLLARTRPAPRGRTRTATAEEDAAARALLEVRPDHAGALVTVARYAMAEEQYEEALANLDRAAELEPARAETYLLRARCNRVLGRQFEAFADASTAENLEPGWIEAVAELGLVYYDFEALDKALPLLEAVLEKSPDWIEALLYRALVRGKAEDEKGALEDLDRLLSIEENADAYYTRAVLHARAKRNAEAASDLKKVIELEGESDRARELLKRVEGG